MTYLRYLARRAAFALASVYAVLTIAYLVGRVLIGTDIENALANARYNGASPAELARLERSLTSTFGVDEPILDRLVGWWVDVTTLDWGYSSAYDEPILAVLDERALTTLEYVIPGVVVAMLLGVVVGLLIALRRRGILDWSARLTAYALLGVPAFMLAVYVQELSGTTIPLVAGWELVFHRLDTKTVAALTVGGSLLAGQLRFARASALEQTGEAFVKMLRAKGAGRVRLARHVLRNAAIPIVSLSITELLAVLVLNIYAIERILAIDGLAVLSLRAVGVVQGGSFTPVMADVPLLVWSVMIIVFIGIGLSFLQDVLYGYLDPRVATE